VAPAQIRICETPSAELTNGEVVGIGVAVGSAWNRGGMFAVRFRRWDASTVRRLRSSGDRGTGTWGIGSYSGLYHRLDWVIKAGRVIMLLSRGALVGNLWFEAHQAGHWYKGAGKRALLEEGRGERRKVTMTSA